MSATPAQNRRPPRLPADRARTYVDAKPAVTSEGRDGEKISLIMDLATENKPWVIVDTEGNVCVYRRN